MNEQIWKLQGQAKVLAEEIVSKRKYDDYMEYKQCLMDQTMNVFAEMIIKECLDFCRHEPNEDPYDSYDIGYDSATQNIRKAIQVHFGVEE